MSAAEPTWIVLIRDLSNAALVDDEPALFGALILDADTGLIRGVSMAPKAQAATVEAMRTALTKPALDQPARPPRTVVCAAGQAPALRRALARVVGGAKVPPVTESDLIDEAEDIFDSLIGRLSGREQPGELPSPADWRVLHGLALEYLRRGLWQRWSDADPLRVLVEIDDERVEYVLVVLGQEGIQRGLNLYPGIVMPDLAGLGDADLDEAPRLPAGTALVWLDPLEQTPFEFAAKARRYGWPDTEELLPTWLTFGPAGPTDLDRRTARHLAVAIAAVLDHDRRPRTGAGNGNDVAARTQGRVALGDGANAAYTIG